MIQWFMLQNRAGKTRLSKFYEPYSDEDKRKVEQETFRTLSTRDSKWANFCEVRRGICRPCLGQVAMGVAALLCSEPVS